jgi:flagellin-like protein
MKLNEKAVSPVVGVMLMLVVTIVLGAVVSSFSGGLMVDEQKTPQTSIAARIIIESIQDANTSNWQPDYPANFSADNRLEFEHLGGDGFSLNDIEIQLQSRTTKYTISLADQINTTVRSEDDANSATTCLPSTISAYITEIGSNDGYIQPGDKFELHADNCRIDSFGSQISWKPVGAVHGIGIYKYTVIEYKIIHKPSGKAISTGTVEVI